MTYNSTEIDLTTQELNLADLTKLYLNEHHHLLVESDPGTFNELLDFYSVIESAAMVCYISDLPTAFTQIAQRNLSNAEFRQYYELNCSALLPHLLYSRLTGAFRLYEEHVADQVSIHHLFAEFIGLAMRVRHDDTIQIFRQLISHHRVDGFDLNDVGIILRDPADCAERLIKPVGQRTAVDQAVCGFKEFVKFAIEFDDLLTRCSEHRLFQSAQFHCFASWFDIGTLARTWIHDAMLQVAKWQGNAEVANEFQAEEDRQDYFAAVQDAMERLFSSEYGGPLRNVAAHIFSGQQIDRIGVKRITCIAGDEAKRVDYGKHKTGLVMSVSQQHLWFIHQLDPTNVAYARSMVLRLVGELNIDVLQRSISEVVSRHEVLRARFQYHDGTPTMVVATELPVRADEIDLREVSESSKEERTNNLISDIIKQPFDLAFGLPFRARLIQKKDREYVLLFVLHEIICDSWSLQLLLSEIQQLYESFCLGQESPLPELPIEYSDFSRWQQKWLTSRVARQQLAYWQSQLDKVAELQLPTDRPPRFSMVTREARTIAKLMNGEVAMRMRALGRREGATVFMIGLAVVNILLSRYSGQRDITIGIDVANRHSSGTEGLIGLFANTLALRTHLSANLTFRELVATVRRQMLEAYVHQEVPFEHVVEALQLERHLRRSPLFQVKFGLNIGHQTNFKMGEIEGELLPPASQAAKVDLEFFLTEDKDDFICSVVYDTELFETTSVNRMLMHWLHLSEQSVADYEKYICDLQILSSEEIQQIWIEWNRTKSPYPQSSIHRLFEHHAQATPHAIAIRCGDQELTYRELNTSANQLARYLRQLGTYWESIIGIYMERGTDIIIAMLAILKAGGAYLPLDVRYPPERLRYVVQHATVRIVITHSWTGSDSFLDAVEHVVPYDTEREQLDKENKSNLRDDSAPEALAYVMYTSGSTGTPKGVCIPHRGVVRLVREANYIKIEPSDRVLQLSSIAFDHSTFEIWGCLLNGAQLIVHSSGFVDGGQLGDILHQYKISVLWLVASILRLVIEEQLSSLTRVREILAGGEVLPTADVRRILDAGGRITNGYGPTENTTFSCCYRAVSCDWSSESVPIGAPISNSEAYVLDEQMQLVPIGVCGELYVGGAGLARGYLGDPYQTAERFVPNPFGDESGSRIYRTGDLVRRLADGNLEFIGRTDQQVKIRGFRIELGEIEAVLLERMEIKAAAVILVEDNAKERRLVAYIVEREGEKTDFEKLQAHLRSSLPEYMIPAAFVRLETLPLTSSGKLNRNSLPKPTWDAEEYHAPRNSAEELISKIFSELLGNDRVGIHDDFFALGGHSLLAIRVISRVRSLFGVELPLRSLFDQSTVAELAEVVAGLEKADVSRILRSTADIIEEGPTFSDAALAALREKGREEALSRRAEEVNVDEIQDLVRMADAVADEVRIAARAALLTGYKIGIAENKEIRKKTI